MTPRLAQLAGLFDIPPSSRSRTEWDVTLDVDARPWNIGLIVGASGSGKTTIASELWPRKIVRAYRWPRAASIVDAFPESLSIKAITGALCSVGFSSPPAWVRPWQCLSTGEQFRANLARAIASATGLIVYDEFTSVVDRVVAKTASAAVAKAVRRAGAQFVAVTCHGDVEDWLQPDWTYRPATDRLDWRSVQRRPPIDLEIRRVDPSAWVLFKRHHYLTGTLHRGARCWVAFWGDVPVAFESAISHPQKGGRRGLFREHRLVCLPDYQGVGIGAGFSAHIGALFRATGCRWTSRTAHPGLIRHRTRSPLWRVSQRYGPTLPKQLESMKDRGLKHAGFIPLRFAATFEYIGPPHPDGALAAQLLARTSLPHLKGRRT